MTSRLAVVAALLLAGCGGGAPETPSVQDSMRLRSPAFKDGGTIPARYTCASVGKSPPLAWSSVPARAREMALVVIDPDAPGGGFVHWVLYHLPPGIHRLGAGGTPDAALQAVNSAGKAAWAPPCPPEGDEPHHYEFTLYALKAPLGLQEGVSADDAVAAIGREAIAQGRLTGRFGR